jgi:hypothetical protein
MGLITIKINGLDKTIKKVKGVSAKHILKLEMKEDVFNITTPIRINQEDKDYIKHYGVQYLKGLKGSEPDEFTRVYIFSLPSGIADSEKVYKYLNDDEIQAYLIEDVNALEALG